MQDSHTPQSRPYDVVAEDRAKPPHLHHDVDKDLFFFDLLCSSFENLSHRTSLMQIIRFFFSARTSAPPFQGDEQDMSALKNKD